MLVAATLVVGVIRGMLVQEPNLSDRLRIFLVVFFLRLAGLW